MKKLARLTLPGLLALGACVGQTEDSIDPPDEVVNFDAHDHSEVLPGNMRRTLIRQPDGQIVEVVVEIRNGYAIMEGDILIGTEDQLVEPGHGIPRSNILNVGGDLWESNIIPYDDSDLPSATKALVQTAISRWQSATPMRFVKRTNETDYLEFTDDSDGCFSAIGRTGWGQNVNLDSTCTAGNAMHEIGHALGLYHEQARSDRGSFITYYDANVEWGKGHNFSLEGTKHGAFDWGSMMLYSSFAFTANNGPTMLAKDRWSMISGGNGNWSDFRSNEPKSLYDVRFGDFDGDGLTDAIKLEGTTLSFSKSTTGPWTARSFVPAGTSIGSIKVGKFDWFAGDDLFRTDGAAWYISTGGAGAWTKINDSTYVASQLFLGDFDGDGLTDTMRPDGTRWNWSKSGRNQWATLNTSGYTYGRIAVGTFDALPGDDVLITTGTEWKYSSGGSTVATTINTSTVEAKDMILGKFNGNALTDIVYPGAIGRYDISNDGRSQWQTFNSGGSTPTASYVRVVDQNNDGRDDILCQGVFFGQRANLSAGDVAAINSMYFGTWQVSRGGTSGWQYLNQSNYGMSDVLFADFNADGIDDVFRADGTTWWVSYSGTGSWTYLNSSGYKIGEIALGDFDGDKRADVFRTDGSKWWISKDGKGGWTQRNSSGYVLSQMKFGDLDGNGSTDVFIATGTQWRYSKGGASGWVNLNTSGVTNVALVNMDGDTKVDVFAATGTQWQYSSGGTSAWQNLASSGYTLGQVKFGDFDGNKKADVLRTDGTRWYWSKDGVGAWATLNTSGYQLPSLRIGKFDSDSKADIVTLIPKIAN